MPEAARGAEVSHPSTTTKTTRRVYNLRKGKNGNCGNDYSRHFGDHSMALVHIVLTHLSMKSGLRKYKCEVCASVTKDFLQLHTQEAFGSLEAEDMTEEKKKDALEMLMFIKEKCDGTIKARVCADGRKHCEKYNTTDAASPIFSTEAVLISPVINAYGEWDVAVVNTLGAYLSADTDDEVFMIFRGKMAELMVSANPTLYRKYISYRKKGDALLYVSFQKALYGCLKSALIFNKKLVGDLEAHGFEINTYDLCVANKTVGGKELTIKWHGDDLKISHVNRKFVLDNIVLLGSIYVEMHGTCDKRHKYLGM